MLVHWVRIPHYSPGPVIWNCGSSISVLYQQKENLVPAVPGRRAVRGHGLRLGERLVFIRLKSKGRMISWGMEGVP